MPTVKMPRADWELLVMLLEQNSQGYLVGPLVKDIEDQVYSQEY